MGKYLPTKLPLCQDVIVFWMAALTADSIMNRLDVVAPEITPVIFTAPHNIFLRRDGKPDHKPEDQEIVLPEVCRKRHGDAHS